MEGSSRINIPSPLSGIPGGDLGVPPSTTSEASQETVDQVNALSVSNLMEQDRGYEVDWKTRLFYLNRGRINRSPKAVSPSNESNKSSSSVAEADKVQCEKLEKYFQDHPNIKIDEWKDGYGNTQLHRAAGACFLLCMKVLVEKKGANVNAKNPNGLTPLAMCAKVDWLEGFDYLINKGASLNECNAYQMHPIHLASKYGSQKVLGRIIEIISPQAEQLNCLDESLSTGMHYAVVHDHIEVLKKLMLAQASINKKDIKDYTPVLVAAAWGRVDFLRLLVEKGAPVDVIGSSGETIINLVVTSENREAVEFVLETLKKQMGNEALEELINRKDKMGLTAHQLATPKLRSLLEAYGAKEVPLVETDAKCSACFQILYYPVNPNCGHSFCRPCMYNYQWKKLTACPKCSQQLRVLKNDLPSLEYKEQVIYRSCEIQLKERLKSGKALDCLVDNLAFLSERWQMDIVLNRDHSFHCNVDHCRLSFRYFTDRELLLLSIPFAYFKGSLQKLMEVLLTYQKFSFARVGWVPQGEEGKIKLAICSVFVPMRFASRGTVYRAAEALISLANTWQKMMSSSVFNEKKSLDEQVVEQLRGIKISHEHLEEEDDAMEQNLASLLPTQYRVTSTGENSWSIEVINKRPSVKIAMTYESQIIQFSSLLDEVPVMLEGYYDLLNLAASTTAGTENLAFFIEKGNLFGRWNFSLEKEDWDTFSTNTINKNLLVFIQVIEESKRVIHETKIEQFKRILSDYNARMEMNGAPLDPPGSFRNGSNSCKTS